MIKSCEEIVPQSLLLVHALNLKHIARIALVFFDIILVLTRFRCAVLAFELVYFAAIALHVLGLLLRRCRASSLV